MEIRTYRDMIEWTRDLHGRLAKCLDHAASHHSDERASMLLQYLAAHEYDIERMVDAFERQAAPGASHTRLYDYLPHNSITTHLVCDDYYGKLDANAICAEVFDFHEQIISLYRSLIGKAEIPEAVELMRSLLEMEEHEAKRLVRQTERMDEL